MYTKPTEKSTLTVLDCSSQNANSLTYLGYILNSIHRKLPTDLKKSKIAKEFSLILNNSKLSVLNFSDRSPQFLKEISDTLLFPIGKNKMAKQPESI